MRYQRSLTVACTALLMAVALFFTGQSARAQSSNATISGTVFDTTGAVIPGAKVVLTNEQNGIQRFGVSNSRGFFTFVSIPPNTYSVKVSHKGFVSWEVTGIVLHSNDNRSVLGIKLKAGGSEQTVVVKSSEGFEPTTSGKMQFTIGRKVMQNVAIVGQNAAEFIKIMPGMAMNAGALNQSSYAGADEATGNGPVGSFSANGQRNGALDITSDGAHIVDPGCNCGQAENTNINMTASVTVKTSNFGADSAKGPVVINTVGKSGGRHYHGEAYLYSRYHIFNANDWLGNNAGVNPATGQQIAPRPKTSYFYPGANIGGPLIIPGTNINHNHNKLFFFLAEESYRQNVDNGIYHAVVPTQAMRSGNFTDATYMKELLGSAVNNVPNNGGPTGNAYTNGIMNPAAASATGKGLISVYPLPTANPVANGGYNYINSQTRYSNMWQLRARVDYNISDSTKLYVEYNHQKDSREESLDTLWTGNAQSWDDPTTPYPSPIVESTRSEVITANMTHVFSPTLTNETIFNWVYLNLPNKFQDPNKVSRAGLGINYTMLFNHPNESNLIYPEMTGWGNGISNQLNSGFELNGTVFAKKTLPSLADNITKVWNTHTAKFGFYWERTWNSQPGNSPVNGNTVFSNWGANTTGNAYADMLIGQATQYSEQNFNTIPAFQYISTAFYGQDSWKISNRLTLDYGVRFEHLGDWQDITGYGFAAWYPNLYSQNVGGSVGGATFPGIEWHKVHPATPLTGAAHRLFFVSPRFGFAWDLFGTGNTVLRGGFGIYHFHDSQNVQNGAFGIVQGSFSSPTLTASSTAGQWNGNFSDLSPSLIGGTLAVPSGVTALDPTDDHQPRTMDWSFSVAQRAPWHSLVQISYVGNKSDYLSNYNNNFYQINDLPVGALFKAYGWLPDCYPAGNPPTDGGACAASGADTGFNSTDTQAIRPYTHYSGIKIINHKMYSNYNALQASWNKQQGHSIFMLNYTFSKALGIRGENGSATGDPTDLAHNYGVLPNNRFQIFNAAYVYQFPNMKKGNRFVRALANWWQVSGITQYQGGADIQAAISNNFGYTAYIPAGTTFMGKTITTAIQASNQNTLGSGDVNLMPKVICDPRKGLGKHQYVNGKCFAPFATPGQQGTYIFPTMTGPGYFDTDLSLFKDFVFGKSQSKKLTFRFSGYNFLNHPNISFQNNDPALNLQFDQNGNMKQAAPGINFGTAYYKVGHRIMQGEVLFSF